MSDATASAPSRATLKKATAKPALLDQPPPASDGLRAKYLALGEVLYDACRTDEPEIRTGNSTRLVRIAYELTEMEQVSIDERSDDRGHDIAALLSASRRVPGDQRQSQHRHDLVEKAGKILEGIADCADILRQDEAPATAREKASGHTPEQYRAILEVIAGRASTLNNVLMMLQGIRGDWEGSVLADAAQSMCVAIGAMADVEGDIIGDADRWNFGPNFATAGKAGAA